MAALWALIASSRVTCRPTAWRPAHLHFTIGAPGYERLVTQVFRRGDPYLDSDAVFGVKEELVRDYVDHPPGTAPDGTKRDSTYSTNSCCF